MDPFCVYFQVNFECNLVGRGGHYRIAVVREVKAASAGSTIPDINLLSTVTINIKYPTVVFEVPHRIEAYTTSTPITFALTRSSSCSPKLPLPSTVLTLSLCTRGVSPSTSLYSSKYAKTDIGDRDDDDLDASDDTSESVNSWNKEEEKNLEEIDCNRDFVTLFDNPLSTLQVRYIESEEVYKRTRTRSKGTLSSFLIRKGL
jgi:hypothetical protein